MPQRKTILKSSPSSSELSRSAWQAALEKAQQMEADEIPANWIDYDQFAEKMGYCKAVAADKLRKLVATGIAEKRDFRVKWGNTIRPRPYFRLK